MQIAVLLFVSLSVGCDDIVSPPKIDREAVKSRELSTEERNRRILEEFSAIPWQSEGVRVIRSNVTVDRIHVSELSGPSVKVRINIPDERGMAHSYEVDMKDNEYVHLYATISVFLDGASLPSLVVFKDGEVREARPVLLAIIPLEPLWKEGMVKGIKK